MEKKFNWDKLNKRIERDPLYRFCVRHKKMLNIVQGLVVIGLLIGINTFVYHDHFLKKQIAERCGYVDATYECICDAHGVEDWKEYQQNMMNLDWINFTSDLNFTEVE